MSRKRKKRKTFRAFIVACDDVDGDTFDLMIDVGWGIKLDRRVRLDGVDTPELRSGPALTRRLARLAASRALGFVCRGVEADAAEFVCRKKGKYGRDVGDILVAGESLVEWLIAERLGVRYTGGDRAPLQALHRAHARVLLAASAAEAAEEADDAAH